MQVMIADDDALSRKVLEDSLLSWGYDVLVTKNGEEAWEVLSQPNHPNLIILDWMMPGYDGVDICRMLRRREGSRYTYVILLTSRDSRKDLVIGLESGVDDYITKPFDPEELKYRLRIGERIVALEERILSMARRLSDWSAKPSGFYGTPGRREKPQYTRRKKSEYDHGGY